MDKYRATALSLALLGVAAAPAWGEATGREQSGQGRGEESGKVVVVGEVVDTRDVTISGSDGKQHRLFKVRTADDKTVILDIGEQTRATTELQQGEFVMAIGTKARINGQPVLFTRYYGPSYAGGRNVTDDERS